MSRKFRADDKNDCVLNTDNFYHYFVIIVYLVTQTNVYILHKNKRNIIMRLVAIHENHVGICKILKYYFSRKYINILHCMYQCYIHWKAWLRNLFREIIVYANNYFHTILIFYLQKSKTFYNIALKWNFKYLKPL